MRRVIYNTRQPLPPSLLFLRCSRARTSTLFQPFSSVASPFVPSSPALYSHDKQKYRQAHYTDHHHTTLTEDQRHEQLKHNRDKHRAEEKDTVLEFQILPIGTSESSMSTYVATCAHILKDSELRHEVHSMGTVMEGSLEECFDVLKECIRRSLRRAPRLIVNMKADVRPGFSNRMHQKNRRITEVLQNIDHQG